MKLLERRRALMSALSKFIRVILGKPPLVLSACVDNKSTVDYKLYGESVQKMLPTEYQSVEYIESTGTQYINTGVIPNQNTGFDIVFLTKNTISTSGYGAVMGARQSSMTKELQLTTYNEGTSKNQGILRYGTGKYYNAGIVVDTKMHITLKDKFYTNNIDVNHSVVGEFDTGVPLALFALNENGKIQQNGLVQLYSLKLFQGNALVRDFVPCYRKSSNVIGLYDLVEEKFYSNAGSGTFLKGSDTTAVRPAPDTPVEVESVGELVNDETDANYGKYKIPVVASGNVFNIEKATFAHANATFKKENTSLIFTTSSASNTYPSTSNLNAFNLKPNTKYVCRALVTEIDRGSSDPSQSGSMRRSLRLQTLKATYDSKAIYIVNGYGGIYKGENTEIITKFTTPADMSNYKYVVTRQAPNMEVIFKDIVIMEDLGQSINDYEPYQEPITTNIYLDEPLRKVGNYADYIDFKNQVVVRNIKKANLKKASNTYTWTGKQGVYFLNVLDGKYGRSANALSNRNYNSWTEMQTYTKSSGMWVGADSQHFYWIGILDCLGLTTLSEFNNWLVNNPTYLLYGSTKPTTTQIELPQLPTFKGTTIYSIDTSIQPSNMEVSYYSKERSVS